MGSPGGYWVRHRAAPSPDRPGLELGRKHHRAFTVCQAYLERFTRTINPHSVPLSYARLLPSPFHRGGNQGRQLSQAPLTPWQHCLTSSQGATCQPATPGDGMREGRVGREEGTRGRLGWQREERRLGSLHARPLCIFRGSSISLTSAEGPGTHVG